MGGKMPKRLDQGMILNTLDYVYGLAVNGVPGLDSAEEMAENYLKSERPIHGSVNSLIRWQNTKATTSGFLSGLGGVVTMPVLIPANIASVIYVQVRMIAAIAVMGGHNIRDDKVKSLVYACMAGNAAKDVLKEVGIKIGTKVTQTLVEKISFEAIKKINQAVGFRLLTKFGSTGVINIGKAVPLIGGFIGGTFDGVTTNIIGNVARDTFINVGDFKINKSTRKLVENPDLKQKCNKLQSPGQPSNRHFPTTITAIRT